MSSPQEYQGPSVSAESEAKAPVVYVHGDELRHIQDTFFEKMYPKGSSHMPWFAGEVFDRLLPIHLEEQVKKSIAEGMPEAEIDEKIAEEWDDTRSRLMSDVVALYGSEAYSFFPSDAKIKWFINDQREDFLEEAQARQYELEQHKKEFIQLVEFAIDHRGLPITKEQLHDRLSGVRVGFSDVLNLFSEDETGSYSADTGGVMAHIGFQGADLRHTVFHELLHAISGQRIVKSDETLSGIKGRRIGLGHSPQDRKLWLNEAVTDNLANILVRAVDGVGLPNFGDDNEPLPTVLLPGSGDLYDDYNSEIVAAKSVMAQIPSKTLLRAYFAEDNDPFEKDQRAGIHAERDLQRAIKVASGAKRIKELRLLDAGFEDEHAKKKSLKFAKKLERRDSRVSIRKRRKYENAVLANQERRRVMISHARTHFNLTKDSKQ